MDVPRQITAFDPSDFHPGTKTSFSLPVNGVPDQTEAVHIPGVLIAGSRPGRKVVVAAGVHGDEYEGIAALHNLAGELDPQAVSGTVLLLPVCNPAAFRAGSRETPDDGKNLARVFPGRRDGSVTERMAFNIFTQLVLPFEAVLDLHGGGTRMLHAPIACFYDFPGEAGEASLRAAASLAFPRLWSVPLRDGVLTYEAGKRGLVAVGVEFGGGGRCLAEDAAFYRKAVKSFLAYWDILPATTASIPLPERYYTGDWLVSPESGFFRIAVDMDEEVEPGSLLGTIHDVWGTVLAEVRSPHAGVVLGYRSAPPVLAGEILMFILQEKNICDLRKK